MKIDIEKLTEHMQKKGFCPGAINLYDFDNSSAREKDGSYVCGSNKNTKENCRKCWKAALTPFKKHVLKRAPPCIRLYGRTLTIPESIAYFKKKNIKIDPCWRTK